MHRIGEDEKKCVDAGEELHLILTACVHIPLGGKVSLTRAHVHNSGTVRPVPMITRRCSMKLIAHMICASLIQNELLKSPAAVLYLE